MRFKMPSIADARGRFTNIGVLVVVLLQLAAPTHAQQVDPNLYVGGEFFNVGGQARTRIAALDATTGDATSWNPTADSWVWNIVPHNGKIYTGGQFTNIGGQARNFIAALDSTSGAATSWNPNSDVRLRALR